MDDTFLMRVLDRLADRDEQFDAFADREFTQVAELRDRDPSDEFHREEGAAGFGHAAVEDPGDARMIHDRQRLSFCFEARDDLAGIHA